MKIDPGMLLKTNNRSKRLGGYPGMLLKKQAVYLLARIALRRRALAGGLPAQGSSGDGSGCVRAVHEPPLRRQEISRILLGFAKQKTNPLRFVTRLESDGVSGFGQNKPIFQEVSLSAVSRQLPHMSARRVFLLLSF